MFVITCLDALGPFNPKLFDWLNGWSIEEEGNLIPINLVDTREIRLENMLLAKRSM